MNFDETWAVPAEDLDATWPIGSRAKEAERSATHPSPAEVACGEAALRERV